MLQNFSLISNKQLICLLFLEILILWVYFFYSGFIFFTVWEVFILRGGILRDQCFFFPLSTSEFISPRIVLHSVPSVQPEDRVPTELRPAQPTCAWLTSVWFMLLREEGGSCRAFEHVLWNGISPILNLSISKIITLYVAWSSRSSFTVRNSVRTLSQELWDLARAVSTLLLLRAVRERSGAQRCVWAHRALLTLVEWWTLRLKFDVHWKEN